MLAVRPRKRPHQDRKLGPSGPREVTLFTATFDRVKFARHVTTRSMAYNDFSIQRASTAFGAAPTLMSATDPFLMMASVGIDLTP